MYTERQKFTQKERDNETGLDFFKARYYSSSQGRFASADTFAGSTINPQSLNLYAYVLGNPHRFRDPSGHLAIGGASGDLNDWFKWYKRAGGYLDGMKPSMPRGLCGSACGGQNPSQPQDPSKPNLPPAIAPAGVPDIPEGTVGTATVTEWNPIPPHKSFWQRVKAFFGFGSSAAAGISMWGKPETLQDHFERHGGEFGARTSEEYAQQAQELFVRAAEGGAKMKIGPDGVIRVYEAETNTFAAYNMNGTTRTMFKPNAEDFYFVRQPGRSPWFPRGAAEPETEPEFEPEVEPEIPIEPIP